MIILDTHIWVWWIHSDPRLPSDYVHCIKTHEETGLGISAISCWEVAKLVERRRLVLPIPIVDWFEQAFSYPGITLMELSPRICIESTQLPGSFHRDPADQLIVATARIHSCPLVSMDQNILAYPHVMTALQHPCSQ
jgi:PIN domain nuclease of toxin-antitoxin system